MKEIEFRELDTIIEKHKKVLVEFHLPSCQPCKLLCKMLDTVDTDFEMVKIEVNSELVEKYEINSVPTVLLFNEGKLINSFSGLKPKTQLMELLS